MKKKKRKIYSHQVIGGFWFNDVNYHFEFSISKPFDSLEEARADKCVARFEIYNGHVIVFIYTGWRDDAVDSNIWYECTTGEVVEIIEWEQWWKYRLTQRRAEAYYKQTLDPQLDYIPCSMNWDDLFQVETLAPDWGLNVDCFADYITRCV